MNRFSDSDSADSDDGIRYKTDSTRFKDLSPSRRSRSRSPRECHRRRSSDSSIGPQLPPHLQKSSQVLEIGPKLSPHLEEEKSGSSIGPQLPPHLQKQEESSYGPQLPPHLTSHEPSCIGPHLPPHLRQKLAEEAPQVPMEDSDEDDYGPLPAGSSMSRTQIALEERALQLKMDQLGPNKDKDPVREEWMLELPEVKAAGLGLGARQFRKKDGPDMSDRSSWTDTPERKSKKKEEKVDLKKEAEDKEIRRRDEEQEKMAKKHKKKSKESLLEMHQSKLKDKKKDEGPRERRPFSRDVDLQVNRFDEAQKKAVLKKAQLLDDRFSRGQSKFL